jgi:MSHA biogenesis protein MshJ
MTPLRQKWQSLNERYMALSRRERMLVAAAAVLGPLLIGNALIIDPQSAKVAALKGSIAQQSTQLAELQAQTGNLQRQLQIDPDAAAKNELKALHETQQKLDDDLHQFSDTLVRPEEMNGLLERLLARQPGLRLVSLKTLAPQSVLGEKQTSGIKGEVAKVLNKQFDLYKHGVQIRLQGSYGELQAYLAQLEKLQKQLLWGELQYKVLAYPKAEMSLMVYTLSPDRAWLAL